MLKLLQMIYLSVVNHLKTKYVILLSFDYIYLWNII